MTGAQAVPWLLMHMLRAVCSCIVTMHDMLAVNVVTWRRFHVSKLSETSQSNFVFCWPPNHDCLLVTCCLLPFVMYRDNMACTPCPEAHKGAYHGATDEGTFTPDIPQLSQCTWDLFEIPNQLNCIPVEGNPNLNICGTYKATCHLKDDSKRGCKFPEACQDTMVTVQGVSYFLEKAVRVAPLVESVDTCPPGGGGGDETHGENGHCGRRCVINVKPGKRPPPAPHTYSHTLPSV